MLDRIKKRMRLLYLLAAIIAFSVGGAIAFWGNSLGNPLLIVIGFGGLTGGVLLLRRWHGEKEIRVLGKVSANPPNCLAVSENYIDLVYIEDKKKLLGLSQKCLNDGKYYHVHKIDNGTTVHLELPDDDENERHYDPAEMANVVTMPSNKKYFTWSASLMQTIKIGIMAIVVGAELIGLIAMGG